jgi:hypothetical protein
LSKQKGRQGGKVNSSTLLRVGGLNTLNVRTPVVFGGQNYATTINFTGTDGNETLTGTSTRELMSGKGGSDVFVRRTGRVAKSGH